MHKTHKKPEIVLLQWPFVVAYKQLIDTGDIIIVVTHKKIFLSLIVVFLPWVTK